MSAFSVPPFFGENWPFKFCPTARTPQQFNTLVQRIESQRSRHPRYYRTRLRGLALLGYTYIIGVLSLLGAIVWTIRHFLLAQNLYPTYFLDLVVIILAINSIRLFLFYSPPPNGIPITRSQAPELFGLLDDFIEQLKAPPVHQVLLTYDLNAAVVQRPRWGIAGWPTNYLLLGLPLMVVLSSTQFQAVVVHELSHLAGYDSRFSSWIYQVRRFWFELSEQCERSDQKAWLFRRFFRWYGPFFQAYSFVLARSNEYEADRTAARWVGINTKAEALLQLRIYSHFLHHVVWPNVYQRATTSLEPPSHTITLVLNALKRGPSDDMARTTIELALMEITDNDDTHPCLSDRLHALGYSVDIDQLPFPSPTTAAQTFLGTDLNHWIDQLDLAWSQTHTMEWQLQRFKQQQQIQCLKRLRQKRHRTTLTIEETWQCAYLTQQFYGRQAAIPLFQRVLVRSPHHPYANYHLGKILVEQENWSGIHLLEQAMTHHPTLVIPCAELLYEVYQSRQQHRQALTYRQRRQQHQALWAITKIERRTLRISDRFRPHNLPLEECQQLAESLHQQDGVQIAYLVQKVLDIDTDPPLYVLGILRCTVPEPNVNRLDDVAFSAGLKAGLCFSGDLNVVVFKRPSAPLCRRIQQIKSARLYCQ